MPSPTCWWRRTALAQGRRDAATEALAVAGTFIIDSTRYAVRAQAALLGARLQEPEAAYASALRSRAKPDGCT